jgi:hypothetical protein
MQTPEELAKALIGTKHLPPGLAALKARSAEARAYHALEPYPLYHFRDWKIEDRGPLPRCMPLPKSIINRGARWLFGKPVRIQCAGNEALEKFLTTAWEQNRMQTRLRPMAVNGALDGGVVLKFSYDSTREERPLSIQSLNLVSQARLYYDPHDRDRLLMARIQYPYFDAASGSTFWYREEWTDAEEVHYVPLKMETLQAAKGDPDACQGWEIESRAVNPFGLIPVSHIRNIDQDDVWGEGDLWDLYRVIDRFNLTYHLMDKSNQFDSTLNPVFIDLDLSDEDIERPLSPGQPLAAETTKGEGQQGKVVYPPSGNSLRPAMMEYAREVKKQLLSAASSSELDQAEVTNKGNLTAAVLELIFQPQIDLTNDKRKSWGTDGLAAFLARAARGLRNLGVQNLGVTDNPDTYAVALKWSPYFELSDEEKQVRTDRLKVQEDNAYLPHDRAVEEVSQMEGRHDLKQLKQELEAEKAEREKRLAQEAKDTEAAAGGNDPPGTAPAKQNGAASPSPGGAVPVGK